MEPKENGEKMRDKTKKRMEVESVRWRIIGEKSEVMSLVRSRW